MVREVGGAASAAACAERMSVGRRTDTPDAENVFGGGDVRSTGRAGERGRCEIRQRNGRLAAADRVSLADCRGGRAIYSLGRDSRSAREDGAATSARVWGEAGQGCGGGAEELGADQGAGAARGAGEEWGWRG